MSSNRLWSVITKRRDFTTGDFFDSPADFDHESTVRVDVDRRPDKFLPADRETDPVTGQIRPFAETRQRRSKTGSNILKILIFESL